MSSALLSIFPTLALEWAVFVLMFFVWLLRPSLGESALRFLSRVVTRVSRHALLSCVAVFGITVSFAIATRLAVGPPAPVVHDEFSYILAGTTFAQGQLSGPAPPLQNHFETFHVLLSPSHASKYPPGQGLSLAVGILVGGDAIWGVWLVAALACSAFTWALRAWLPSRWALYGGLLASLIFGLFNDWSQTYWGGGLAALGGTVFFGAGWRLLRRPSASTAVLLAFGALILLNSRPFEGAIAMALGGAVGLAQHLRRPMASSFQFALPALAASLVGVGGAGLMAFYNWSVVGDAATMPYIVYEEQHSSAPVFLWRRAPSGPPLSEPLQERFRQWALAEHAHKRTLEGFVGAKIVEVLFAWFSFGRILFLPFALAAIDGRVRWTRSSATICGVLFLIVLAETWTSSRKLAPVAILVLLLIVQGLRQLRIAGRSTQIPHAGLAASRALVTAVVVSSLAGFQGSLLARQEAAYARLHKRPALLLELEGQPGSDLVFVRYTDRHIFHAEWVYNEPDILASKVAWARDLGMSRNCELISHFSDRNVWLLQPDLEPLVLQPYPMAGC